MCFNLKIMLHKTTWSQLGIVSTQQQIAHLVTILAGQSDISEVAAGAEISEGGGCGLLELVPTEAHPVSFHPSSSTAGQ